MVLAVGSKQEAMQTITFPFLSREFVAIRVFLCDMKTQSQLSALRLNWFDSPFCDWSPFLIKFIQSSVIMSDLKIFSLSIFFVLLLCANCESDFFMDNIKVLRNVMRGLSEKTTRSLENGKNCSMSAPSVITITSAVDRTLNDYIAEVDHNAMFEKLDKVIHVFSSA